MVLEASFISSFTTVALLNSLDVIVVRRQSGSKQSIAEMFREEGPKIFTKGIGALWIQVTLSSMIFFVTMDRIGKVFNTTLSEDFE